MTPGQVFLLVLFLLYLSDCFLLVPRRGFAFLSISGRRGRWRVALPSTALGNGSGGLVMTPPLPPLGRALIAGFWPISLAAEGFTSLAVSCPNPGLRPAQPTGFVRWKDLKEVGWEGRKLFVNDKLFLKLGSPEIARMYAKLLLKLAPLSAAERGREIGRWCQRELSAKRVRRRRELFDRATSSLRQSCNMLFVLAFVVVPLAYWRFGSQMPFLVAVAAGVLLMVMIGVEFWCLHRRFYPEQKAERLQLWLLVGFMPQYAIRAVDELSKSFLGNAHPLAAAEALLGDERFGGFRDAVLRDLAYPEPFAMDDDDHGEALAAARQFRAEFERPAVEAAAGRRSDEEVRSEPDPAMLAEGSTRFCPRCLMPYEKVAEDCVDCGGVELVRLG